MKHINDSLKIQKFKKKSKFDDQEPDETGASDGKNYGGKKRRRESPEFRCRYCNTIIGPTLSGGGERNHCPSWLHSVHLDETPGDRVSNCKSLMEPISIWVRKTEWALLHRCRGCGTIHSNRIAADDNEMLLLSLAVKAIGNPAFPLARVTED